VLSGIKFFDTYLTLFFRTFEKMKYNAKELSIKNPLTQDEIMFLIEEYIYATKGVGVKCSVNQHPLVAKSELETMAFLLPFAIAHFKE
jgi:hypothetical protein